MMNKLVLVGIGIAAVGLLALPQTLALFVGQHNFYDTTTSDNGVPCQKCHTDISQELSQPSQVNLLHRSQSSDGGCQACHIVVAPQQKEGLQPGPGGQFHAAAAPMCIDCHGGTGPGLSAMEILTGSEEVHKPFANQANNSKFLKGPNEACISCHTHVNVDITWTKATNISIAATEFTDANGHNWTVGNYVATGTAIVQTNGTGNGTGTATFK